MPRTFVRILGLVLFCLVASVAHAWSPPMAWLDRDQVALDDTVELIIELDGTVRTLPDLDVLRSDFTVTGQSFERGFALGDKGVEQRIVVRLRLQPRRTGELEIPMFRVGREFTAPIRLTVLPARGTSGGAFSGDESSQDDASGSDVSQAHTVTVESRVDASSPYVQQTVGYTVRWFYDSGAIVDGEMVQDPPEGASLQRLGEDIPLTARQGGRFIKVFERRYLLIPERPGTITVPPARFRGRGRGLFDSVFDPARHEIDERSQPIALQVKPIPTNAPQPWLPLRALSLRYLEAPQKLRVGETATVTVALTAEGAMSAQLPELKLEVGAGAQVFPDQSRRDARFEDGRVQATVIRRFAILPQREGTLRIPGPRQTWWDANAGVMRIASLPDLLLTVAPGQPGVARDAATGASGSQRGASSSGGWPSWLPRGGWLIAAAVLILAWIGAVAWAWRLLTRHREQQAASARPGTFAPPAPSLAQVLAQGDLATIAHHLCTLAGPPSVDLDGLRERLSDPAQRAAIAALQRARWGDGTRAETHAATLAALRGAFAQGPRWRAASAGSGVADVLPPLYPA